MSDLRSLAAGVGVFSGVYGKKKCFWMHITRGLDF